MPEGSDMFCETFERKPGEGLMEKAEGAEFRRKAGGAAAAPDLNLDDSPRQL